MQTTFHIFWQFFLLGLMSFGGPAAHIGYFRKAFVEDKKWLSDHDYSQLVALSQFLPGPGSSQVGFAIGHQKGGLPGAVAAFIGFTLPSFILIVLFAVLTASHLLNESTLDGIIRGLKILAVVVVADALLGMYQSFCQKRLTASIAFVSAVILILQPSISHQLALIVLAGLVGLLFFRNLTGANNSEQQNNPKLIIENKQNGLLNELNKFNWTAAFLFVLLAFGLPLFSSENVWLKLFTDFYYAGSLVFGGGHVVLPLLQELVADSITNDRFLTGYAAAQAIPGPMFTFASFLGSELQPSSPWFGALVATSAIFLPGFILILVFKNAWLSLASNPKLSGATTGINACVVGLLMAAFYTPVVQSGINTSIDLGLALLGVMALRVHKTPVLYLVLCYVLLGLFFS